jgi:hypothetical protein
MNQDDMRFIVSRSTLERRSEKRRAPPYLTEEGMVLVDRRVMQDRRGASLPADTENMETDAELAYG